MKMLKVFFLHQWMDDSQGIAEDENMIGFSLP